MLEHHIPVRYELLRPEEVKALRAATPIAYIPAGSLEWHSFQNPLGTDALKAHAVCCEAALKYGGLVLPPFFQGLLGDDNWGPEGWAGYTLGFNQSEVFEATMLAIVRALVFSDWKVIVGVTGHDIQEQLEPMRRAIEQGTSGTGATGFAVLEGELNPDPPEEDVPYKMDHAGAWETSCMMYAWPDRVDLDTLRSRKLSDEEKMSLRGPEGIGGFNPVKYASAELGKRIIEKMGDLIGRKASEMLTALRKEK